MTPMVIAIAITVITAAIIVAFWVTMFRTFRRSSHTMLSIWCVVLSAVLYGCANLVSLRLTAPTVAQSLAVSGVEPRQSYPLFVGANHGGDQPVRAVIDPSTYDGHAVKMGLHVRPPQGGSALTCTIPVQSREIDRDRDMTPYASSVTFLIYKNAPSGVKARHFAGVLYDEAESYGGCVGLTLAITGPDVTPVITLSEQDRAQLESGRSS